MREQKDILAAKLIDVILGTDEDYERFVAECDEDEDKSPRAFIQEIFDQSQRMNDDYHLRIHELIKFYECDEKTAILLNYFTSAWEKMNSM